jgi:Domain of unknown function (DUF4157)
MLDNRNYAVEEVGSAQGTQALDGNLRQKLERSFCYDFSDVVIDTSEHAHALNKELGTLAFTIGKTIFFRKGVFRQDTDWGKFILAHELAHVVQKHLPASQSLSPEDFNKCPSEKEANEAAWSFLTGKPFQCIQPVPPHTPSAWEEAGHYYTAYFVLKAAGAPKNQALEIAKFAQFADEVQEADAFSLFKKHFFMPDPSPMKDHEYGDHEAMKRDEEYRAWRKGIPSTRDRTRENIRVIHRGLHALTGRNVEIEQRCRAQILEEALQKNDDFITGLALHAFGDSYAHRDRKNKSMLSSEYWGHGFDSFTHKHEVDNIGTYREVYIDYCENLYAIARDKWSPPPTDNLNITFLDEFRKQVDDILKVAGKGSKAGDRAAIALMREISKLKDGYAPENIEALPASDYASKMGMRDDEIRSCTEKAFVAATQWQHYSLYSKGNQKAKISTYDEEMKQFQSKFKVS